MKKIVLLAIMSISLLGIISCGYSALDPEKVSPTSTEELMYEFGASYETLDLTDSIDTSTSTSISDDGQYVYFSVNYNSDWYNLSLSDPTSISVVVEITKIDDQTVTTETIASTLYSQITQTGTSTATLYVVLASAITGYDESTYSYSAYISGSSVSVDYQYESPIYGVVANTSVLSITEPTATYTVKASDATADEYTVSGYALDVELAGVDYSNESNTKQANRVVYASYVKEGSAVLAAAPTSLSLSSHYDETTKKCVIDIPLAGYSSDFSASFAEGDTIYLWVLTCVSDKN